MDFLAWLHIRQQEIIWKRQSLILKAGFRFVLWIMIDQKILLILRGQMEAGFVTCDQRQHLIFLSHKPQKNPVLHGKQIKLVTEFIWLYYLMMA